MGRRAALVCVAAMLLAGCSQTAGWTKPGADAADVAAALQQCRGAADRTVAPEESIDEDIEATRGVDWARSQIGDIARAELGAGTQSRGERITAACMQTEGFVPAP
jgi:hypothetical protein